MGYNEYHRKLEDKKKSLRDNFQNPTFTVPAPSRRCRRASKMPAIDASRKSNAIDL